MFINNYANVEIPVDYKQMWEEYASYLEKLCDVDVVVYTDNSLALIVEGNQRILVKDFDVERFTDLFHTFVIGIKVARGEVIDSDYI